MDSKLVIFLVVVLAAVVHQVVADYLWHKDEIPYRSDAKCARGVSYYTNDDNINETTIDIKSDMESLLLYPNKTLCFFCVCSVSGEGVNCLNRDPWVCDYYRTIEKKNAAKERYEKLFQQDRPAYFRQLSYRLRRTMDNGIYELLDTVGSYLDAKSCVPYVSEYTDCTDANQCSGCNRCTCNGEGKWSCHKVTECAPVKEAVDTPVDENSLDSAFNGLNSMVKNMKNSKPQQPPARAPRSEDLVLGRNDELEEKILSLMQRKKRAIKTNKSVEENKTIKFYNTRDEINEDTLKHINTSGTIEAKKVEIPASVLNSRRSGVHSNISSDSPLHISYNQPMVYHITDNKIDTTAHVQEQDYHLGEIFGIVTNHTQKEKDKDLSKIVVNELKKGEEIIGDKNAPVTSNITFTPENDTLTAMAFIAGNLLNKLWSMEKDSSRESLETEAMKHEKISDLLELFKEPLTMRQESFLKGALEKLSDAIDKNKDVGNVSLCHDLQEAQKMLKDISNSSWEVTEIKEPHKSTRKYSENDEEKRNLEEIQRKVTQEAIDKINHVLSLIKKFEGVNKNLNDVKRMPKSDLKETLPKPISKTNYDSISKLMSDSEHQSVNLFGNVLEKITKLLLPSKISKKFSNKIRNQHIFATNDDDIKKKLKKMFNVDLSNTTLTAKDKLVLDYLNKIRSNPKLLLEDISNQDMPDHTIEGDILLNLSQFFKIKSFVDLMKLLESKKPDNHSTTMATKKPTSNEYPLQATTTRYRSEEEVTETYGKLTNTKEKLKAHLRTILDDLMQLQRENGIPTKEGKLRIADALPCIYNILRSDVGSPNNILADKSDASERLAAVFDSLKKDLKSASKTRRFNSKITEDRPKSAIVWERIVKNVDGELRRQGRRNFDAKPKSVKELVNMLELVESLVDNSYKNIALSTEVNAAEKLVLMKALQKDARQYIEVIENIKGTLSNTESLTLDERNDINDFADNVDLSNNLSKKVLKNLDKPKNRNVVYENFNAKNLINKHMEEMKLPKVRPANDRNMKLTRTAILNQLIRNRVTMYLKLKESTASNMEDDPNYDIAKNILYNLEHGNNRLAAELYRVFVTTKKINGNSKFSVPAPTRKSNLGQSTLDKEPIIDFDDPKARSRKNLMTQDQLIKQLMALKNIRS